MAASEEVPIDTVGRILAGDDAGQYVRIVDDRENTGGFLILVQSSREGGDGHDYWVADRTALSRFVAESNWQIDWRP